VDLETMNLSPDAVEDAITPRTKAVIAVHMAGRACEMNELRDICDRHRLRLIADAAHAVETQYRGDPVSRFADVSVYSFYATKNITTAEGGMVVTDDHEVADRIAARRLHGISRDAWKRYTEDGGSEYETLYPGFKYNLTDLQSSLGLHQLARVEDSWSVRRRHVAAYRARLEGVPGVSLPTLDAPENRHAHHLFNIFVEPTRLTLNRSGFADALRELNIGTGIHFTPIHLHAYYRERFGFERGSLPNAEWIGERTLSLPLSAALSSEDVADVADAVRRVAAASNAIAA
jgi:dTDP-4-amino-4,6-dideoxygalactose transaminase